MPWVRIDDHMPEHPKVDAVGHLAAWLNVAALCHCNRNLTDGFVSAAVLPRLTTIPSPKSHANRLCAEGLWHRVDGGYLIHDYMAYQKSAEAIRKERKAATARQTRFRNGSRNAVTDGVTNGRTNSVTPTVSHGSSDGHVTPSPLPNPTGTTTDHLQRHSSANVTEPKAPLLSKAERAKILAPARAVVRADGGVSDLDVKPESKTK